MQPLESAPAIVKHLGDAVPVDQIFPFADLVFGGGVLVGVVLVHGVLMRMVQSRVAIMYARLQKAPVEWKADVMLALSVLALLASVVLEMILWTAAIKYMGFFRTWSAAAYYAANTYTTLGYGTVFLPEQWRMVGPIMATSGLFTFGWTGSVLVDVVARVGRVKDLAVQAKEARSMRRHESHSSESGPQDVP